ncbi:MAG: hypothetical protein M1817_002016 [Caeruleum heppii]|nr:MAG: hypothetical protein M1817_002016 [Caeruleum heppii]
MPLWKPRTTGTDAASSDPPPRPGPTGRSGGPGASSVPSRATNRPRYKPAVLSPPSSSRPAPPLPLSDLSKLSEADFQSVCAGVYSQLLRTRTGRSTRHGRPQVEELIETPVMATPTVDKFLSSLSDLLRTRNALELRSYLLVEPPLPPIYSSLTSELRQAFPKGGNSVNALDRKCTQLLPEDRDRNPDDEAGTSWPAFVTFAREYLEYLRDVNVENLLDTHQLLSSLTNQCITALSNSTLGLIILPACISLSATLARLASNLDKRPELTAHLLRRKIVANGDDDSDSKQTLVEGTAELIQRAFTICLTDRTSSPQGIGPDGKPEGKKIGIYCFANLVLKLLFQCHKTRLASQIFTNIAQQSPPLSAFPASQRVSYLYYLGRFSFSNNHFLRAQASLEAAYLQCHSRCLGQRRSILVYLITCNIILGRFPSSKLLARAEASGLSERFSPVCIAIARGDLGSFKDSLRGKHETWFLRRGILLPLRNRCEVLVWRSLARKTFLLGGTSGDDSKKAPTFSLQDLLHLAQALEGRSSHPGTVHQGAGYTDPDLEDTEEAPEALLPNTAEIEAILASLIDQGLLHGFLSHKLQKFAILGSKRKGAEGGLKVGFPNVWDVLQRQLGPRPELSVIPGWRKDEGRYPKRSGGAYGPGMVVNLSGARPAGAALS